MILKPYIKFDLPTIMEHISHHNTETQGVIDPNLLCAICGGLLHEAVLTPCGHSFCYQCLRTWLSRDCVTSSRSTCPECRGTVSVCDVRPIHAVRNLIKNITSKNGGSADHGGSPVSLRPNQEDVASEDVGTSSTARPECVGCGLICVSWTELLQHQTRCEVIGAAFADSNHIRLENELWMESRDNRIRTNTEEGFRANSRAPSRTSLEESIGENVNLRRSIGNAGSSSSALADGLGIDMRTSGPSVRVDTSSCIRPDIRTANISNLNTRVNLDGVLRDFNCCTTQFTSRLTPTSNDSRYFPQNERSFRYRSLPCEVTDLACMVATLEIELKRVKRDLEAADIKNRKLDRELKRTKEELEGKRVQLLEQQYVEFDPDYDYGFDPNTISQLSCVIAKFLLKKPPYVNRDLTFASIKRCYDNFSRSGDEYEHDVHMLVATAYASNWFSEAQKLSFHCWLQSIASFRQFSSGTIPSP